MPNVEFNDENRSASVLYGKFQSSNQVPTLVRWVMAVGVKTPEAANKILLGIAVCAVLLTGIIIYRMNAGGARKLTPEQIKAMEGMVQIRAQ